MRQPSRKYSGAGVTMLEIMIASAILMILCAIAIPNFALIKSNTYKDVCITNLRRIVSAKEHWAMETGAADTDTPTAEDLDFYVKDGISSLKCVCDPQKTFSTSYSINAINANPACRIIPGTHKLQ